MENIDMHTRFLHHATKLVCLLFIFASSQALAIKAPDFSLPGDKKTIALKDYRKKVVYVDFWASWCTPCKQSFPWMSEMQKRYKKEGLEIIAINVDKDRSLATEFLEQSVPGFTIAYDPEGKVAESYDLSVMPSSFLIDRKGKLVHVHKGFKTTEKNAMEGKIKSLLSK
ncbi:MAG: TlpA disulfide reductase family protein [Gammaproteobacteria bacterium]